MKARVLLFLLPLFIAIANAETNKCGLSGFVSQNLYTSMFPDKNISVQAMMKKSDGSYKNLISLNQETVNTDWYTTMVEVDNNTSVADLNLVVANTVDTRRSHCIKGKENSKAYCDSYYTYNNLLNALNHLKSQDSGTYGLFVCRGSELDRLREISGFLANMAQETNGGNPPEPNSQLIDMATANVGLIYAMSRITEDAKPYDNELGTKALPTLYQKFCQAPYPCVNESDSKYCTDVASVCRGYDPNKAKVDSNMWYYGRGPKQLTYFSNYIVYGEYIDPNNSTALAKNPNLLVESPYVGWATGLAYWNKRYFQKTSVKDAYGTYYTDSYKPSMHEVMYQDLFDSLKNKDGRGGYGFGQTINVINGGVECGLGFANYTSLNRINMYLEAMVRIAAANNMHQPFDHVSIATKSGVHTFSYGLIKARVDNPIKFIKKSWAQAFYTSAALPLSYYNYDGDPVNKRATKILLCYDGSCKNHERLDCADYKTWEGWKPNE